MSTETYTGRADTLPGAYSVTHPRQAAGSRRDRYIHELQERVRELEEVVDLMGPALTELRRHVQFHTGFPKDECGLCYPSDAERAAGRIS